MVVFGSSYLEYFKIHFDSVSSRSDTTPFPYLLTLVSHNRLVIYSLILPLCSYISSVVQPTYNKVSMDWENVFVITGANFLTKGFICTWLSHRIFDKALELKSLNNWVKDSPCRVRSKLHHNFLNVKISSAFSPFLRHDFPLSSPRGYQNYLNLWVS